MLVNIKKQSMKEETIAVQLQSQRPVYAFFITTCNKTHSSYQVKLQKEVKSTQKQPNCKKKVQPMQKKTA